MDKTLQTKTSLLKQTYLTRSQQLMEKSIKKSGSSSVEAFAAKWKIPIIDHDDILRLCKKAMLQEELPVGRRKKLQAPFIKMEDQSRKYKPEFFEFKRFPFIDTTVPLPLSPFDTWHKLNSKVNKKIINEIKVKQYFCELCNEHYETLQMHLDTAKHKNAAMDDARYAGVDTLIKQGVCWEDFVKSVDKKSAAIPCNNE